MPTSHFSRGGIFSFSSSLYLRHTTLKSSQRMWFLFTKGSLQKHFLFIMGETDRLIFDCRSMSQSNQASLMDETYKPKVWNEVNIFVRWCQAKKFSRPDKFHVELIYCHWITDISQQESAASDQKLQYENGPKSLIRPGWGFLYLSKCACCDLSL